MKHKGLITAILLVFLFAVSATAERELTTNEDTIILIPLIVDFSDGVTPENGLTVTEITVELIQEKDDGSVPVRTAFAPTASGGSNDMVIITSSAHGNYGLEIAAGQINYTGYLTVTVIDTDIFVPVTRHFKIVTANVVDSGYGADKLQVDTVEVNGTGQTANDMSGDVDAIVGATIAYTGGVLSATDTAITLDPTPVATADYYNKSFITIVSGTGVGQTRKIVDWATATASIAPRWKVNPASNSVATIIPFGRVMVHQFGDTAKDEIGDAVLDEALSGHQTIGTLGWYIYKIRVALGLIRGTHY